MRLWKLVLLIWVCAVLSGLLSAQAQPPNTYPATLWIPCDEHHPAPRLVAGPTVVAKAGKYRAMVRVDQESSCVNTTKLIVSRAAGKQKTIWVEPPKPKEQLTGNGMNLVDWSPDGKLLLAELWYWTQEPNDAGIDKQVLLFSPGSGSVREIETDPFLADQKDRSCYLDFELLGFTPEGWVAMRTHITQFYEVDEQQLSDIPPTRRCVEKHETWAVDPETQLRTALPKDFRTVRYSEVKESARSVSSAH